MIPTRLGVCRETAPGDRRVALVPDDVHLAAGTGLRVLVESGAGEGVGLPDRAYRAAGAETASRADVREAEIVVGLSPPAPAPGAGFRRGQVLVALVDPFRSPFRIRRWADEGLTVIGLDLVPEGSDEARSLDAASSLERLAGYKAGLLAVDLLDRPVRGSWGPGAPANAARALVIGWGPGAEEAARVLRDCGADVHTDSGRPGAGVVPGGLDILVTAVRPRLPGPPPRLVTARVLDTMRPGSVVVDLAAGPDGGNVVGARPGAPSTAGHGVVLVGAGPRADQLPGAACQAFSRHVVALLERIMSDGVPWIDVEDAVLAAVLVTHGGLVRRRDIRRMVLEQTALAGLP
ncbi:hypothetical protein [Streptomyces sp. NPDC086023]|uniref:hypothetical protein n=1 Tax=Streptomyces sp. NPDC086023 TaxID=3365746 RepID=UPI0037CCFF10